MNGLDWTLLQSFVAVANHGSLSAAASARNTSQPTLSRHISQLEDLLGTRLFERSKSGMELTSEGAGLLAQAQKMADAADHLTLKAAGRASALSGTVRITASQIVATYLLPPVLTALSEQEPGIEIELIATDRTENLLRRDADIALRMFRPTTGDIFTRKVADFRLGMFAAQSYVARHGTPRTFEDLLSHRLIGFDRSTLILDGFARAGLSVGREDFSFRSDDQVVCWQMVAAGFGIGFNQRTVAHGTPGVVELETDVQIGTMPLWLTAHKELKSSPRVRRVFDHLAEAFLALEV